MATEADRRPRTGPRQGEVRHARRRARRSSWQSRSAACPFPRLERCSRSASVPLPGMSRRCSHRPSRTPRPTIDLIGDELFVREAYVGQGPVLKRWRARARGRVGRIHKRTCHIVVGLAEFDEELRALYAEQALASEPVDPEPVDDEALQDTTEAAELDADVDADETAATAVDEEVAKLSMRPRQTTRPSWRQSRQWTTSRSRRMRRQRRTSRQRRPSRRPSTSRSLTSRVTRRSPTPGYADHTAKEVIKELE